MKKIISAVIPFLILCHPGVKAQTWSQLQDRFVDSFEAGKYKSADTLAAKALRKARTEKDRTHLATSLYYLGRVRNALGNYPDADSLYQLALTLRRQLYRKTDPEYVEVLNSIGLLYEAMGMYSEAEPVLDTVLVINQRTLGNQDAKTLTSLNNMASLSLAMGDFQKAGPLFDSVLAAISRSSGDSGKAYARALNNKGMFLLEAGNYPQAEPLLQRARELTRTIYKENSAAYATALNNLGLLYSDIGSNVRAARLLEQSLRIKENILTLDHPSYATTLNNLAIVYRNAGLKEEADSLLQIALKIRYANGRGANSPDYATALDILASFYLDEGKYDRADTLASIALTIRSRVLGDSHPDYATSLNRLGMVLQKEGEFDKAKDLYQHCLRIRKLILGEMNPSYIGSLSNMAAVCLSLKQYGEAEQYFQEANRLLVRQIETYFPALSEKEKDDFLQTVDFHFDVYNAFAASIARDNPFILGDMYDLQLFLKSILLNSAVGLRKDIYAGNDKDLIADYHRYVSLKERIARSYILGKQVASEQDIDLSRLEEEANALEKSLSLRSSDFAHNHDTTHRSWKDIRAVLQPGEAAVEMIRYHQYTDHWIDSFSYSALIVTPDTKDHPLIVTLGNGTDLDEKWRAIYKLAVQQKSLVRDFGSKTTGKVTRQQLDSLYLNYWGKIGAALSGISRIYFSPDGVYHLINLNALRNPADSAFVFDKTDLRIVLSTRDILNPQKTVATESNTAFLMGNPDFKKGSDALKDIVRNLPFSYDIQALPGSRQEIVDLTDLLRSAGWKVSSYTNDSAVKPVLQSVHNPTLLHLSTHGFFIDDIDSSNDSIPHASPARFTSNSSLYTGLLFTGAEATLNRGLANIPNPPGETDNGILTADEAGDLDLRQTKLVVLSACETAIGDLIRNGEGAYGLERAFRIAGASSILCSMWKVEDVATQKLMGFFYKNWLSMPDVHTALRQAQRQLRTEYPDPYYWSAFLVISD